MAELNKRNCVIAEAEFRYRNDCCFHLNSTHRSDPYSTEISLQNTLFMIQIAVVHVKAGFDSAVV